MKFTTPRLMTASILLSIFVQVSTPVIINAEEQSPNTTNSNVSIKGDVSNNASPSILEESSTQKAGSKYRYTINPNTLNFIDRGDDGGAPDPYGSLLMEYLDEYGNSLGTVEIWYGPYYQSNKNSNSLDSVTFDSNTRVKSLRFSGHIVDYDEGNGNDYMFITDRFNNYPNTSAPITVDIKTSGTIILTGESDATYASLSGFSTSEDFIMANPIPQNLTVGDSLPNYNSMLDFMGEDPSSIDVKLTNEEDINLNKAGDYTAKFHLSTGIGAQNLDVPIHIGLGNTLYSKRKADSSKTAFALTSRYDTTNKTTNLKATEGTGFQANTPLDASNPAEYIHLKGYSASNSDLTTPINEQTEAPIFDISALGTETSEQLQAKVTANAGLEDGSILSYQIKETDNIFNHKDDETESLDYKGFDTNLYEINQGKYNLLSLNHLVPKENIQINQNLSGDALKEKAKEFFDLSETPNVTVVGFDQAPDTSKLGEQEVKLRVKEKMPVSNNEVFYTYSSKATIEEVNEAPTAEPVAKTLKQFTNFDLSAKDLVKNIHDDHDNSSEISVEFVGDLPDMKKLGEQNVTVRLTDTKGKTTDIAVPITIVSNLDKVTGKVQIIKVGDKLTGDVASLLNNPNNYSLSIDKIGETQRTIPGFEFVTVTVKSDDGQIQDIKIPVNDINEETTVYDLDKNIAVNVDPIQTLSVSKISELDSTELNQLLIDKSKATSWDMLTGSSNTLGITKNDIQLSSGVYPVTFTGKNEKNELSKTINVTLTGELSIQNMPEKIEFGDVEIPSKPTEVLRENENFGFDVVNTIGANWKLSIGAEQMSGANTEKTMNLSYVNEEGQKVRLSEAPLQIASGTKQESNANISWKKDKGIVLNLDPGKTKVDEYHAKVNFYIEDTP